MANSLLLFPQITLRVNHVNPPRYYCKSGQSSGTDRPCKAGEVCVKGSSAPGYCLDGKITYEMEQWECVPCQEGLSYIAMVTVPMVTCIGYTECVPCQEGLSYIAMVTVPS